MLIYLALSEVLVCAVLVLEDKDTQSPIYYVTKKLLDTETEYSHLEKLALPLIVTIRKLRPYFQCNPIFVVTIFCYEVSYTSLNYRDDLPNGHSS